MAGTRGLFGLRSIARALLLALPLAVAAAMPAAAGDVVVFAAASLKNALDDAAAAWRAETGGGVRIAYAGSSALARQIEAGAPADVFISANTAWMDVLDDAGLLAPGTRRDLLTNRLVLVAHGADAAPVTLDADGDLAARLGDGRLAMALVDAVPAGIYGKAAMVSLGLWEALAPKVAEADNVRTALALVARGEAPLGIVYATDAAAEADVTVVATFPAESHPPIVYPAAVLAESDNADAAGFLDFLASDEARPLFQRQGFAVAR